MKRRWIALLLFPFLFSCSNMPVAESPQKGLLDDLSALRPEVPIDEKDFAQNPELKALGQLRAETARWFWPLKSIKVTSGFGQRGKHFHEGVDLKARSGTPIFAAEDGTVLYAGRRIKGYGNMIVLKHASGMYTVYAHLSKSLMKKGQVIAKGQKIALSGRTGRASGPHLHFEVRKGLIAMDPVKIMPEQPIALVSAR